MTPTAQPDVVSPSFHDDAESLPEYHTLSVLALVSLVFGLASPLCFAAPVLTIVPLFGAAISLVALRRIAASEDALAGRWAATAGLALCVASLLAVLGYTQFKRMLQVNQAEEFGRSWLTLVQAGDLEQAFRLTYQAAQPAPPADEPGAPKTNPYHDFNASPVIQGISAIGAGGQVRFDETLDYEGRAQGSCIIQQRFAISGEPTQSLQPLSIDLRMQRARLPRELHPRWLVISYTSKDAADGSENSHDGHVH